MSLSRALANARAAEAAFEAAHAGATEAGTRLAGELRRAATPGRVLVGGLGLGFVAGRSGPGLAGGLAGASKFAAGPLFELATQALLPALMAGLAAAQAAADDEAAGLDDAAPEDEDTGIDDGGPGGADPPAGEAGADGEDEGDEDDGPAPTPPPRRRR